MAEKVLKTEITAEDRQFERNKWIFSVSGIGRDMSYQLISSFLMTYIQFGTTLSVQQFAVISLLIGVLGRVWDAVNDPMMGAIIEGTHMKFGKFKPWILIGAVTCGITLVAIFNVPISITGWKFVIYMIVMYLLWESTFTMNDIGYWSMLASLSSKKEQRNSATMLTVVFAGVGAFAAQGGISFLIPGNVRQAFSWISIAIAGIFVAMQVAAAILLKEKPRTQMEQEESVSMKKMFKTIKNNDQLLWMSLSLLLYSAGSALLVGLAYNLYYLEIGYDGLTIVFIAIFGVLNIGAQALYPRLERKLGRRKFQTVSIVAADVGYLGIALLGWIPALPFNLVTLSLCGAFVFVGQAWYYMSCIINMTNCVEYNEYKHGERNEAVVSTLRPFVAKVSDALKYGITTLVIAVSVFTLSQNISTMESQKGAFDRMDSTSQYNYLISANQMYNQALRLDGESDEAYAERLAALNEQIDADPSLQGHQLEAEYLVAFGDVAVMEVGNENVFVCYLKDSNLQSKITSGKNYTIAINGKDANGNDFNVANDNFHDIGMRAENVSMRLWIRAAVTVIPAILITLSLLIQHKKFVIDEEYYDMMLAEIEKKKAQPASQE